METFWGLYYIYLFVFLRPLWIFLLHMEILLYIHHYYIVRILNHCSCLHKYYWYFYFILGLENYWYCMLSHNLCLSINTTKTRTEVIEPAYVKCIQLSDTFHDLSCASIISLLMFITYLAFIHNLIWDTHIILVQQQFYFFTKIFFRQNIRNNIRGQVSLHILSPS